MGPVYLAWAHLRYRGPALVGPLLVLVICLLLLFTQVGVYRAGQNHDAQRTRSARRKAQLDEASLKIKRTMEDLKDDIQLLREKVNLLARKDSAAMQNLANLRSLKAGSVPDQEVRRVELAAESAKSDLDSAKIMLKKAENAYQRAPEEGEAQLKALEANLDFEAHLIKFPWAGVIVMLGVFLLVLFLFRQVLVTEMSNQIRGFAVLKGIGYTNR